MHSFSEVIPSVWNGFPFGAVINIVSRVFLCDDFENNTKKILSRTFSTQIKNVFMEIFISIEISLHLCKGLHMIEFSKYCSRNPLDVRNSEYQQKWICELIISVSKPYLFWTSFCFIIISHSLENASDEKALHKLATTWNPCPLKGDTKAFYKEWFLLQGYLFTFPGLALKLPG